MSGASSSQASVKEYVVRVPKLSKKRYHMMRFNSDLGSDFFKTWSHCKMERENNLKEYKMDDDIPKFGAGSEFGREQREEARRKKFGISVKKYKSENQPWMLKIGGKSGKKFKGIREGGVADNVSWYVFMQGKDGAFEAYPVDEWYNFQPVQRYKSLSAEEAEEEFVRRDKIMNYFQVMYEKKFRKDAVDVDEDEEKKKGSKKKSLMLSEMDDWFSENEDDDDDRNDADEEDNYENAGKGKKKNKKRQINRKKRTGGKKKKQEGGESDDSCIEESDEYNEGAEHDYISSDSSDSDLQNEEVVSKELAGVEEGDALRKLLASDEDDEEEENKEEEEEENKDEEGTEEKKKKKKKKDKKSDKDSDDSSISPAEEHKKKKENSKNDERKKTVSELKRKVKENPHVMPESKRRKLDNSSPGGSGAASGSANNTPSPADSMEDAIRRYLMRKPMTTTELLKNFKKKKDISSEQLVTNIAQILKRVNPVKRTIKGKMYLSLKSS